MEMVLAKYVAGFWLVCASIALGGWTARAQTPPRPTIQSWGYQTSQLDPAALAATPYDALVIDYSRDGTDAGRFTPADVLAIKSRPDGRRRIVLASMSIGDAETHRFYWQRGWENWNVIPNIWSAPAWRARESASERGRRYAVRFWDPAWQEIILGKGGYLERILEAGFDGIWLDKMDSVFDQTASGRDTALVEMVTFVRRIRERARSANANFLIVPHNGEGLLADSGFRALIDGFGVGDLLYSASKIPTPNEPKSVARRRGLISLVIAERKPVLAVEYLDNASQIVTARRELQTLGFVPHFTTRALDTLRVGDTPVTVAETPRDRLIAATRRGIGLTTLVLLTVSMVFVAIGLLRRKPAP